MFVFIYALLGFVQESQILQIYYNIEHFSDRLFNIKKIKVETAM